ncbi:MAG: glycosyltransferase domain-containing protein [Candidatus Aenigmatarchaeota archaeon]
MITLITAIAGGKDNLINNQAKADRYIAFTDRPFKTEIWEQYPVCNKFCEPVMNAKIHKIMPHKYIDTDYSIWIDGNIKIKESAEKIIELLEDADIAVFRHPGRDCIYDEAQACMEMGKGNPDEIQKQIDTYANEDFQKNNGMGECNVIIRKHSSKMNVFNEAWWAEICQHSERDQISFPVVLERFKNIITPKFIEPNAHYHPYFGYLGHIL